MKHIEKRRLRKSLIIIALFAVVLTGFRLLWIKTYSMPEQPEAKNGQLDLRDWDFSEGQSVTLRGEWEFYPYTLLENAPSHHVEKQPQYIKVPDDWSRALNPDDHSPYGFGSYHLRIFVDADKEKTFSIRVPSVRSASALYANGLPVGKSGKVGKTKGFTSMECSLFIDINSRR